MSHHLVIYNDGSVGVMHLRDESQTVEDEVAKWRPERRALVVSHHLLQDGELPAGREFRVAWVHRNGRVEVDMDRARQIHRQRMLAALDRQTRRLPSARRDALYAQITADNLDRFGTPEDLHAHWPAELGERVLGRPLENP